METEAFTIRRFNPGAIIWMENAQAMPQFFIVKKGEVKQTILIQHQEQHNIYKEGDTFGLIGCLTGHQYLDRLMAVKETEVITINKPDLIPFLCSKQDIFMKIVSDYSNRLREINKKLYNLCSECVYHELPEHLLDMAAFFNANDRIEHYYYALSKYLEYGKSEEKKNIAGSLIKDLEKDKNPQLPMPEIIGSRVIYKKGEIIFLEQEKGEHFYLIEKGKVKISHIDKDTEIIVAVLRENEFFGEMSILNQVCRNASAFAYEDVRVLILEQDTFMKELGIKILQTIFTSLAKRLWYAHRKAVNLSYDNPNTRLYDCLDFILRSREEGQIQSPCHFDISINDLRIMTLTSDLDDFMIEDFLTDQNILVKYNTITVVDITKFTDIHTLLISREKMKKKIEEKA